MKNAIIVILLATAVALGGLALNQRTRLNDTRSQLASLKAQMLAAEEQLADQAAAGEKIALAEQKAKILQDTLKQSTAATREQSAQVTELQKSLADARTNSGGGLSALFKDPAMRDMIKAQQKTVLGPLLEKTYAALYKQLNLTPEQSKQLKELIENKMMGSTDLGLSMLDDSMDAAARAELSKKSKETTDAVNAQIKELVGDQNYKTVEDYEKSLPDRMMFSQLHDQLSAGGTELDAGLEQQLIDVMTEERTRFQWTTDYGNNNSSDLQNGNLSEYLQEDRLNRYAEEKERFDSQYLQRVQSMLKPEQFKTLEAYLTNQRLMQVAALKMTAKMFGTRK